MTSPCNLRKTAWNACTASKSLCVAIRLVSACTNCPRLANVDRDLISNSIAAGESVFMKVKNSSSSRLHVSAYSLSTRRHEYNRQKDRICLKLSETRLSSQPLSCPSALLMILNCPTMALFQARIVHQRLVRSVRRTEPSQALLGVPEVYSFATEHVKMQGECSDCTTCLDDVQIDQSLPSRPR